MNPGHRLKVVRDARLTFETMTSLDVDKVPAPPCGARAGCVACDGLRLLASLMEVTRAVGGGREVVARLLDGIELAVLPPAGERLSRLRPEAVEERGLPGERPGADGERHPEP